MIGVMPGKMMKSFPQRKSPRLQGFNYAQARSYFVTICTYDRVHLFGHVDDGVMVLSDLGEIAQDRWLALPDHHSHIELDGFVVMPNHIHGVIALVGTGPALSTPSDNAGVVPTLGAVIGSYKSGVTRRIHDKTQKTEQIVWQDRYHDHIIRDEMDLNRIRDYIVHNPVRWYDDKFFKK